MPNLKPLPARLTQRHTGRRVRIREEARGAVIRRCYNPDHHAYIGAGGLQIAKPDQVFYQPGAIVNLSTDGRRCLVEWAEAEGAPAMWLDVDLLENAE